MKDIRISFPYVEDEDLGIKPLLSDEERASFRRIISESPIPEAVSAARAALETDDALRAQPNAHLLTAVFHRPTVADRDDIEMEAYAIAQRKAIDARIPVDQIMVNFASGTVRVRYLLKHVEDADGNQIGGFHAIPADMVHVVAARLTPWVELQRDARDFLRPPAQASDAASGPPSDTQP